MLWVVINWLSERGQPNFPGRKCLNEDISLALHDKLLAILALCILWIGFLFKDECSSSFFTC